MNTDFFGIYWMYCEVAVFSLPSKMKMKWEMILLD
jgi:hypothetical protein